MFATRFPLLNILLMLEVFSCGVFGVIYNTFSTCTDCMGVYYQDSLFKATILTW